MAFYVATYGLNQLCQCHRPPTALALILRMSYDTSTQSFNSVDQIRPEPACLPYSDFAAADKYLFERARSEDHRCISCGGRIRHLSRYAEVAFSKRMKSGTQGAGAVCVHPGAPTSFQQHQAAADLLLRQKRCRASRLYTTAYYHHLSS